MTRTAFALLALLAGSQALAQDLPRPSARWGSFQMSLSGYRPRIDAEFGGAAQPFDAAFGGGRNVMFRADLGYSLLVNYGTLDVSLGAGFYEKSGRGLLPDGTASTDSTGFRVIPLRLALTYRFDLLAVRYGIPLAPYGRLALDRYQWWVTNGSGGTATADGRSGSGATNGYSIGGGVAFLLNFVDSMLARDMDRNTGINQTWIFVDFTKSFISDFGSARSWDISDDRVTIAGGLLFVF
jgi:hypothetical protein